MMITQALLVALVMFIAKFLDWGYLNITPRPIWIAPLVGLVLGDLTTGIIMGAAIEAVFMGTFTVGGSVPSDITAASIFGAAFGILLGQGTEKAVALAVPIGLLAVLLFNLVVMFFNFVVDYEDRVVAAHNDKAFTRAHYFAMIFYPLVYGVMTFLIIMYGVAPVESFMSSLPVAVNRMLNVMAQTMPALGMAILIKSMWDKEIVPFFFVGFVLAAYLGLNSMAIAILGAAISIYFIQKDFRESKEKAAFKRQPVVAASGTSKIDDEMEDFLS